MTKETIESLREKLDELINKNASFEEIQKVSYQLDECLVDYLEEKMEYEDSL